MHVVEEAFRALYPEKEFPYEAELNYSRKFSDYNANIKLYRNHLQLSLSTQWKGVDKDIQIGLIQSLLAKLFTKGKSKPTTNQIEYYNNFIKKLHLVAPRKESDPHLTERFHLLNEQFFNDTLDQPNLTWGSDSHRKLGHYDFQTDTVVLSTLLQHATPEQLDYVLYHELLHKKLKYTCTNGRTLHHSAEFKRQEALFPNATLIEKQLPYLARKKKQTKRQPPKPKKLPTWRELLNRFK